MFFSSLLKIFFNFLIIVFLFTELSSQSGKCSPVIRPFKKPSSERPHLYLPMPLKLHFYSFPADDDLLWEARNGSMHHIIQNKLRRVATNAKLYIFGVLDENGHICIIVNSAHEQMTVNMSTDKSMPFALIF